MLPECWRVMDGKVLLRLAWWRWAVEGGGRLELEARTASARLERAGPQPRVAAATRGMFSSKGKVLRQSLITLNSPVGQKIL